MNREELKIIIREVILEMKKEKKPKHDQQSREVMAIFYRRNKALNWKRKDYWEACDALISAYGLKCINSKMKALDSMTEYKPQISNPEQLRTKWESIKLPKKAKQITTI